jgi:protein-S-isoprenylcysteine O-methyltransferase Ste14
MKGFMITVGNFFFRWRDTAFSMIFLAGLALIAYPRPGYWVTGWFGDLEVDQRLSLFGLLLVIFGIAVRALVIGFIYVRRAGDRKKIHADELFRHGLFAHSRNPLYAGNLFVVTGAIFTVNLGLFWFIVLPFFYFVYYCIILAEEDFLSKKFRASYAEYLTTVNRLFPGNLNQLRSSFQSLTFQFKRVVKVEYASTSLVLCSLFVANLLKFRYRHGIGYDTALQQSLIAGIVIVLLYYITAASLKQAGKLEWNQKD